MRDGTCEGPGIILGGLPVIAVVDYGKDEDTPNGPGEYWSEVRSLHWQKRDGSKGGVIPEHIVDRAEKADYAFCDLCEQVFDHISHERWLAEQSASVGRNPEGQDPAEGLGAQHEHAVPAEQADAQNGGAA